MRMLRNVVLLLTAGGLTPAALAQEANVAPPAAPAEAAPMVIGGETEVLRIRASAHAQGDVIGGADILDLTQAGPELRAACEALRFPAPSGPGTVEIGYDQISTALAGQGVNLARVLLSGALHCRVDVLAADPGAAAPAGSRPDHEAPVVALASGPAADHTLAGAIRSSVQEEFDALGGQVEIDFERGSGDFLDLAAQQFDFSIRSTGRGDLGLREFKVRISQDGRVQRTVSVFGRVRLMRNVVVAEKPLNIGAYIRPDAVRLAPRLFETQADSGLADLQAVIGQRVDRFIAAGEMVTAGDIRAVDLVQRSRPVTVVSEGAVAMRLNGTALDSGSFGDTVRVRLGQARGDRNVVRGVVTGMATVKLASELGAAEVAVANGGRR